MLHELARGSLSTPDLMALTLKFPKKDDIPAGLESAYVEKDGEWVLDVELPDVSTLERTVRKVREERDGFERTAKTAEAKAADLTRKLEAAELSGSQTAPKIAEMLAKWEKDKEEAVAAAVADKEKEIERLAGRVTKYDLDDALAAAFITAGGRDERKGKALIAAKADGWTLVDGKPVRKDENGQVTTATPADYFGTSFKKELPEFYKGSQASGGGGAGGAGGSGNGAPRVGTTGAAKKPTEWTSEERRGFIEENGPEAYRALLNQQIADSALPKEK